MEDPRKPPEPAPEVGPEDPGSRWVTMPEVGRLLGMSERGARDWVKRRAIPTHGARPVRVSEQAVLAAMAAEERAPRKSPGTSPEASPEVTPEAPGSGAEPIEATYRAAAVVVSPAASAQLAAIRDEWLQPLVDRIAELERERGRLEAQRDTAAQTIEELRRRAEAAERECEEIRQRHEALRASAIFSAPPAPPAATRGAEEHEHDLGDLRPLGRLQRLWRAIRRE